MIRFSCPSCGTPASAPEDCAGRTTHCPRCHQPITVPRPAPPVPPAVPSPITKQKPSRPSAVPSAAPSSAKGATRRPAHSHPHAPPHSQPSKSTLRRGQPPVVDRRRSLAGRVAILGTVLLAVFLMGGLAGYYVFVQLADKRAGSTMKAAEETKVDTTKLALSQPLPGKDAGEVGKEPRSEIPSPGKESKPLVRENLRPAETSLPPKETTPHPSVSPATGLKEAPSPRKEPPSLQPKEDPRGKAEPRPRVELPPPEPVQVTLPKRPMLDPTLDEGRPAEVVFQHRKTTSDEDLRKQLLAVPDVGLGQPSTAVLYAPLLEAQRSGHSPDALDPDYGPRFMAGLARTQRRPDLLFFPWRKGADCQLGKEAADRLHVLSLNLRTCMREATPQGDIRPDPDKLRELLLQGKATLVGVNSAKIKPSEWQQAGAIPALMQMLQPENTPIRLLLVEMLSHIKGQEASVALAQRALYDLSPQVREKAVLALSERPTAEYRQTLLDGLRYPWPAVADHAAEALVAIKDRACVPTLIEMLNEPDPALPFPVKDNGKEIYAVRELVRVSHMGNCMLCHAPSLSKEDLVRGRVPIPGEDPPPLYYAEASGLFVRADTTFLRQDFSVVQPVPNSGKWPGNQRFDYLTRTRPLSKPELTAFQKMRRENARQSTYEQREALLFSLKEITGQNPGTTYEAWKSLKEGATRDRPKEQSRKDD